MFTSLPVTDGRGAASLNRAELVSFRTIWRPVAADEIVSSENFPEEIQQNFLVCNTIGYLGLKNYKPAHSKYALTLRKIREIDDTLQEYKDNQVAGSIETE